MAKTNPQAARYLHYMNKAAERSGGSMAALKTAERGLWSCLTSTCGQGVILIHTLDKQQEKICAVRFAQSL